MTSMNEKYANETQKKLAELLSNDYKAWYFKQHTQNFVNVLVKERNMSRSSARSLARRTIRRALWEQRTSKTPQRENNPNQLVSEKKKKAV